MRFGGLILLAESLSTLNQFLDKHNLGLFLVLADDTDISETENPKINLTGILSDNIEYFRLSSNQLSLFQLVQAYSSVYHTQQLEVLGISVPENSNEIITRINLSSAPSMRRVAVKLSLALIVIMLKSQDEYCILKRIASFL